MLLDVRRRIGLGTLYPTTTVIIQNAVPLHQLGTATGTLNFFRQLGGAIIVAVFSAIVLNAGNTGEGVLTFDKLARRCGRGFCGVVPLGVYCGGGIPLDRARCTAADRRAAVARPGLACREAGGARGPGRGGIAPGKACYSWDAA